MPVTITIDAVFENVSGQHLHHADFTRPCAFGLDRIEVTFLEQFEGGENLWAKQLWAAAIMREGQKGVERVEVALKRAVIGFESPKCEENPRGTP